jgi:hypothetical protein
LRYSIERQITETYAIKCYARAEILARLQLFKGRWHLPVSEVQLVAGEENVSLAMAWHHLSLSVTSLTAEVVAPVAAAAAANRRKFEHPRLCWLSVSTGNKHSF